MSGDARRWTVVVVLLLVAGACTSGEDADEVAAATVPTAEPTPEPAPEATEEAPSEPAADERESEEPDDPFAIPDEIDEDYVQRVLDVFASIEGDALREIAASGMYTPEADELYASIYAEGVLQDHREVWSQTIAADPDLSFLASEPLDRKWDLEELLELDGPCVVLRYEWDRSPSNVTEEELASLLLHMVVEDASNEAANPTPWLIQSMGSLPRGETEIPSLCNGG